MDNFTPRACPLCNTASATRLGVLNVTLDQLRKSEPKQFNLVCCADCELIFLTPLPAKETFDALYIHNTQFDGSVYRGVRETVIVETHRLWLREILESQLMPHFPRWLRHLLKRWGTGHNPKRILEIGSGLSWMSRAAKTLSARTITVAQDITSEAAESCPWVDHYLVGTLESKEEEIQALCPYDVISMTHVIEHLPDPVHVLRQCSTWLASHGTIFVSAPFRPLGWSPSASFELWKNWDLNHTPAHLQYFNQKSMEQCALKSGLRLVKFEPDKDAFIAWLSLGPESR